ncbi:MAG: HAD family phosphatase [Patescibacteria group bacterium]|nr:HAD family phosphatase [Patescibacteria group bacterium]
MPHIRAVVFDMDGLMFNTEEVYTEVGSCLMRRRGHEFTEEIKNLMMGLQAREGFALVIKHLGLNDTVDGIIEESDGEYLALVTDRIRPMPGLLDLLDALERAGTPKAIATSTSLRLASANLTPLGFQSRFAFVLTAEDIQRGKPDPEIYLTAASRLNLPPAEILVLEDSQNGCRAAVAAGAFTVAVPADHSRDHDFAGAAMVIDSLADPRLYAALDLRLP